MIALAGFMFVGVQSANAQQDYSVEFGWDDGNCNCDDPITKEVRFILYTYPGLVFVDDSGWVTPSANPNTINENGPIRTDCHSDCYIVVAFVKYEDGGGVCCTGSASETCTGQELIDGFSFTNTITMN